VKCASLSYCCVSNSTRIRSHKYRARPLNRHLLSLLPVSTRVDARANTWREEREDENGGELNAAGEEEHESPHPLLLLLPPRLMLLLQQCQ
jgi:hypothetical protein